jgi:RNA polymerase sigma-B factor
VGVNVARAADGGAGRAIDERFADYRRTGDRALRDELVEAHVPLAQYLSRRFAHRGESHDDLLQVALLGLLKAVERFDPERGLQFSTFATPTIVGELKRHFRDRGWAMRVPRRVQELHLQLGRAVGSLSQREGRSPTPAELAAYLGVSEEEVLEAMEAGGMYRLASLDAPAPATEDGGDLIGMIGQEDGELDRVEHADELSNLLDALPERERAIVCLRFFRGLTQSEIAERIGISQMHVSRLLARSLDQLRRDARASVGAGE